MHSTQVQPHKDRDAVRELEALVKAEEWMKRRGPVPCLLIPLSVWKGFCPHGSDGPEDVTKRFSSWLPRGSKVTSTHRVADQILLVLEGL